MSHRSTISHTGGSFAALQGSVGQTPYGETIRVLLLGNAGSGKSTLCQWLLGKTTVCEVAGTSNTGTSAVEYAEGSWFDDQALGPLEVIDTPGFKDSKDFDAAHWTETIESIAGVVPKIDAIILCVTSDSGAHASAVLNRVRGTFGTDLWKNMMVYMRIDQGWSTEQGDNNFKAEDFETRTKFLDTLFKQVEGNKSVTPWDESAAGSLMEKEIDNVPYQGGRLVVDSYWGMLQAHQPSHENISTGVMDAQAKRMGLERLVALREHLVAKSKAFGEWDIKTLKPRFGPSKPDDEQHFTCSWPNACTITVKGTYLTDRDVVEIFPEDHVCGQAFNDAFPLPTKDTKALPEPSTGTTERTFKLGGDNLLGKETTKYKVCYCEYGDCDLAMHFFQDIGELSAEPLMCEVPCPTGHDHHKLNDSNHELYCGANPEQLLHDFSVQYECDEGYGIDGQPDVKAFTRKCGIDGQLDAAKACSPVICEAPPVLAQSERVVPAKQGEQFVWKNDVQYKCAEDHTTDANPEGLHAFTMRCGADGKWLYTDAPDSDANAEFMQYGCRKWAATAWGTCSMGCGSGFATRDVTCEPKGAQCDQVRKPAEKDACTSLVGCPDCGKAPDVKEASRLYFAEAAQVLETNGQGLDYVCNDGYSVTGKDDKSVLYTRFTGMCKAVPIGKNGEMEAQLQFFKMVNYSSAGSTFTQQLIEDPNFVKNGCRRWQLSDWSACSVSSGTGLKSRSFSCSTGTEADCVAEDKPNDVELTKECSAA